MPGIVMANQHGPLTSFWLFLAVRSVSFCTTRKAKGNSQFFSLHTSPLLALVSYSLRHPLLSHFPLITSNALRPGPPVLPIMFRYATIAKRYYVRIESASSGWPDSTWRREKKTKEKNEKEKNVAACLFS